MTVDEQNLGNIMFITISEVGFTHLRNSQRNQDSSGFYYIDDDFVIIVSDGVGTCKNAELGSRFAVETCLKVFREMVENQLMQENEIIIEKIIQIWESMINDNNTDDYCTTLQGVFKIGNKAKIISLGDGFTAISSDGFHLKSPTDNTYFANITTSLCSTVKKSDFWISDFNLDTNKSYAIVCCTDGIANGITPGSEIKLTNEIEKNVNCKELRKTLEDFIVELSEYSYDDKTVGVVKYEY